jgi:hypothetical protein
MKENTNIKRKIFYWPEEEKPNEDILRDKFEEFKATFNRVHPIRPKTFTEKEIVQILIDKNYLSAGQTLEDLPIKEIM